MFIYEKKGGIVLDKFYYVDAFVNGEEKTPHYIPNFIMTSRRAPLNYPFIYGCDFRYDGIFLWRLTKQEDSLLIPYSEIKWIELLVVRRCWGTTILTMMIPWFDFDLVIHRKYDEIEIEFPAFYEFREVVEDWNKNGLYVIDHLDLLKRFPDEKSFKENFSAYFEKNYHAIAQQNGLEDPRIGFKKTQW